MQFWIILILLVVVTTQMGQCVTGCSNVCFTEEISCPTEPQNPGIRRLDTWSSGGRCYHDVCSYVCTPPAPSALTDCPSCAQLGCTGCTIAFRVNTTCYPCDAACLECNKTACLKCLSCYDLVNGLCEKSSRAFCQIWHIALICTAVVILFFGLIGFCIYRARQAKTTQINNQPSEINMTNLSNKYQDN